MLATPGDLPVGPDWVYEVEWDGLRVLAEVADGAVTPGDARRPRCHSLLPRAGRADPVVPDVVLDGDARPAHRAERPSRGARRTAPRRSARAARDPHALDVLRLYGVPLLERPQDERRATLERLDLGRAAHVALSPIYTDGPALRAATVQRGLAGVLAKRRDAPYEPGPASTWVRVPR